MSLGAWKHRSHEKCSEEQDNAYPHWKPHIQRHCQRCERGAQKWNHIRHGVQVGNERKPKGLLTNDTAFPAAVYTGLCTSSLAISMIVAYAVAMKTQSPPPIMVNIGPTTMTSIGKAVSNQPERSSIISWTSETPIQSMFKLIIRPTTIIHETIAARPQVLRQRTSRRPNCLKYSLKGSTLQDLGLSKVTMIPKAYSPQITRMVSIVSCNEASCSWTMSILHRVSSTTPSSPMAEGSCFE